MVFVAKGDGTISGMETDKMLALVEEQFGLPSADALALLTDAISILGDSPDLEPLRAVSTMLDDTDKEELVLMMLKVIAADGRKDVEEMDKLSVVAEIAAISPEVVHQAYDRYFDESG
jgi:uncharacterized tellurite resistance protein B-like protein